MGGHNQTVIPKMHVVDFIDYSYALQRIEEQEAIGPHDCQSQLPHVENSEN